MTHNVLRDLILEGAPSKLDADEAMLSMHHSSYTSYSFRIINMMKQRNLTPAQEEDLVVTFSINFYTADLQRWRRTGTFNKQNHEE